MYYVRIKDKFSFLGRSPCSFSGIFSFTLLDDVQTFSFTLLDGGQVFSHLLYWIILQFGIQWSVLKIILAL